MKLLNGSGILIYDPPRPGMKSKTDWWIVVNTDNEICRYYRWWVWKRYMIELNQPSWGAHISVLRGGKPQDDKLHLWKKHHGKIVTFQYSPYIRQTDRNIDGFNYFWFIDVWSEQLNNIREELGFPILFDNKPITYHITIGRTY